MRRLGGVLRINLDTVHMKTLKMREPERTVPNLIASIRHQTTSIVEKRDKDIPSEYLRKSKKLDEKYSNGEKYFGSAIKKFAKGGVP